MKSNEITGESITGIKEAGIVPGQQTQPATPTSTKTQPTPAQQDFEKAYRAAGHQVPGQKYVGNKDTMDKIQQQDKDINDMRIDMAKDAAKRFSMKYDDTGEREPIPQIVEPKQESTDPELARIMKLAGK